MVLVKQKGVHTCTVSPKKMLSKLSVLCRYEFLVLTIVACVGSVDNQQDLIRLNGTYSETVVRPGDSLTLRCTTIGSYIIGWSSIEYIGSGGVRLESIANDTTVQWSQISTARAVLLSTSYNSDGATVLTSALSLTVNGIPSFSVTCFNIGREVNKSIEVNVSVEPELDVSSNGSKICPGKMVNRTFTCETRATDSQTWKVNISNDQGYRDIITASEIVIPHNSILTDSDNIITVNITLVKNFTMVKSGFTVLKGVLNIAIILQSADYDENLTVTCQNDELMTSNTIIIPVGGPDHCGVTPGPTSTGYGPVDKKKKLTPL